MKKEKSLFSRIVNIIIWIVLIVALIYVYKFYQKNNFNDFVRGELISGNSKFQRDKDEKYSDSSSYKITSTNYNDAMFYESIKVQKNTPYKVTCMVKTNNVQSENNLSGSGAQIAIEDSTERSVAITGTTDWQQIEFIFDSKNRDEVNIGFRLGGYIDNCIGEAWFSDFKIEAGIADNSNNWKFACFIFENVDVIVDGKEVNLSITPNDITDISQTINRFQDSCYEMSDKKMTANCDIYKVTEPITTLSYDEEFGYFVGPEDVENQIKDTINSNDYDHIFVIVRLGDKEHINDIEINDWIGLGSMDYYGIGFSNIRLPNSSNSYMYRYDNRINTFPEEVFLHEFLHSLERTLTEYEYDIPALHDYEKYGYKSQILTGLKDWYYVYMNKKVKSSSGNIGLDSIVYTLKPAKQSNFEYSYEIPNAFKEPSNIIEEISQLLNNAFKNAKLIVEQSKE